MEKKAELVFIPAPGIGHLVSTVEMAKLLLDREDHLSITVLIMELQASNSKVSTYTESLTAATSRIRFITLPQPESNSQLGPSTDFVTRFVENHKSLVRNAVSELTESYNSRSDSPRLAGFVIDLFCSSMVDVANEFGVPTYVFFTSNAAFLGMMFHLQTLQDEHNVDVTEFKDSDSELVIPSFKNPVPAKVVLPDLAFDKVGATAFFNHAKRFRETKGIMVNTLAELESYTVESLSNDATIPKIYPVGPILDLQEEIHKQTDIMPWLDDQPPSSVVFLCFGSRGCFGVEQVREIAKGLELSGVRFLWALRQPPPKGEIAYPSDYTNLEKILPEGFLDRTAGIGKVIGWAPQKAVLAHPATGGFVSHCGWNSALESLWFGVPIATWPIYAEQQLNAFGLVKELGLAADIRFDYRGDFGYENADVVSAKEIEGGIRCLMEQDSEIRRKAKEMKEKCRKALMDGGSSYKWLGCLIRDVMDNIP